MRVPVVDDIISKPVAAFHTMDTRIGWSVLVRWNGVSISWCRGQVRSGMEVVRSLSQTLPGGYALPLEEEIVQVTTSLPEDCISASHAPSTSSAR